MENNYEYVQEPQEQQGGLLRGAIGAAIAAVIGALLWGIVGILTNMVYWFVGLAVGAIIAFGYDLFKGRKGWQRTAIVVVCVVLAVVAGDLLYYGWTVHTDYNEITTLLASGSNDEIAQYFFTEEAYKEYQAAHILDKNYNIKLIKNEYSNLTFTTFLQTYYLSNSEFTSAAIGDFVKSIGAALVGSFALIMNSSKKEKAVKTSATNFDEAALSLEAVNADDSVTPEEESKNILA